MQEIKIFQIAIFIVSIVIHEVSHGYMAYALGDPTAKEYGRLTLNPLKHLDIFGSLLLPFLLIISHSPVVLGWAKPVPYNPELLHKDYKYGPLKVALVGPGSNLIIAGFFGLILRFGYVFLSQPIIFILGYIVFINCLLAVFNLIPIPPLDGSKILFTFLPARYTMLLERIGFSGIIFILLLVFFFSSFIFNAAFLLFKLLAGEQAISLFIGL